MVLISATSLSDLLNIIHPIQQVGVIVSIDSQVVEYNHISIELQEQINTGQLQIIHRLVWRIEIRQVF